MKKGFERENASATLLACFNYCLIPIEDFFHFNTFFSSSWSEEKNLEKTLKWFLISRKEQFSKVGGEGRGEGDMREECAARW